MKARKLLIVTVLAIACGGGTQQAAVVPAAGVDAPAAFERLRALAGTWEAAGKDGRKSVTTFELTAGNTVLLERYSNPAMPGGGQMVTAYHLDGDSLVLTHYCIARNQPTLRAERFDAKSGEIQFEFVRASNLSGPNAGYMRRAFYKLIDANHFSTSWEFFEGGKKTMTETEDFYRKQ
jgi:hypothetical protein